MTEETAPGAGFMERAATIAMDWIDVTPIARALEAEYQRGHEHGRQAGRIAYRDELLAKMEVATESPVKPGQPKQPIVKAIEEVPAVGSELQETSEPAAAMEVAAEPPPSPSEPAADQQTASKPSAADHSPRPAGIPTTFAMIREVLTAKPGMTAKETVEAIAAKWWPGLQFKYLGPDISTNITKGRLNRDSDGGLTVTEKGMKSESLDHRIEQVGTRPIPRPEPPAAPPAPPRQVVTPGAKLGPPARGGGSTFTHGGKSVLLHDRELVIAQKLRAAMGAGHLDSKFLANQIGIKSDAEPVMREFVSIMNPKIAAVGLVIEFFKGFGFVMKEVG